MATTIVPLPDISLDPTEKIFWKTICLYAEEGDSKLNRKHGGAILKATYIKSFTPAEQKQSWLAGKSTIVGRGIKNAVIDQLQKSRGNEGAIQIARQIPAVKFVDYDTVILSNFPEEADQFYTTEGTATEKRAATRQYGHSWLTLVDGIKELVENAGEAITDTFFVSEIIPDSAINYARSHTVIETINMLTQEYDFLPVGKRYTHVAMATTEMMRALAADGIEKISARHVHKFTTSMDSISCTAIETKAAKDLLLSFCKTSPDPRINLVAEDLRNDGFTLLMAADRLRKHEIDRAQASDVLKDYQPAVKSKAEDKGPSDDVKALQREVKLLRELHEKRDKPDKPAPKTGGKVQDRLGSSPSPSGCLYPTFIVEEDGTTHCTFCAKPATGAHHANHCYSGQAEKHRHYNTPEAVVPHAIVTCKERKVALGKGPWHDGPTAISKNAEQRAMAVKASNDMDEDVDVEVDATAKVNSDVDHDARYREAYLSGQRDAQSMSFGFGYGGGASGPATQWGDIV